MRARLFRLAQRLIGGERDDAEDIAADVIAALWRRRAEVRPDRVESKAVKLVRRAAAVLRKRRRRMAADTALEDLAATFGNPDDAVAAAELRAVVAEVLKRLSAGERKVLGLSIRGYAIDEIARRQRREEKTVSNQLALARGAVRAALVAHLETPRQGARRGRRAMPHGAAPSETREPS